MDFVYRPPKVEETSRAMVRPPRPPWRTWGIPKGSIVYHDGQFWMLVVLAGAFMDVYKDWVPFDLDKNDPRYRAWKKRKEGR